MRNEMKDSKEIDMNKVFKGSRHLFYDDGISNYFSLERTIRDSMQKIPRLSQTPHDMLKKELDKISSATLTPKETAQLLNVDVRTIRKHLKSGTLKGMRVSERCWRIAKDDILTYFKTTTA